MTQAKAVCEECGASLEERVQANQRGGAVCSACGGEMPTPTATSTPRPDPGDDEAWAAVLARWDDDEAHRAFLARFADLDGLAGAGRRYREALAQRPGDAVALRWRDEIVRRAMAQGLMRSPRPSPPRVSPKLLRWAALAGMIGATVLVAGWMAWRLLRLARS